MPRNPNKTDYSTGFDVFTSVVDPRDTGNTRHHFGEILFIAFAAILCGVRSYAHLSSPIACSFLFPSTLNSQRSNKTFGDTQKVLGRPGKTFSPSPKVLGSLDKTFVGSQKVLEGSHKTLSASQKVLGSLDKTFVGSQKVLGSSDKTFVGSQKVLGSPDKTFVDSQKVLENPGNSIKRRFQGAETVAKCPPRRRKFPTFSSNHPPANMIQGDDSGGEVSIPAMTRYAIYFLGQGVLPFPASYNFHFAAHDSPLTF